MHTAKTGGFRMLASYYEAIRDLPDTERLALYDAICDFGFGNEPGELPPLTAGYFLLLRPTLERSVRFFERQKANGSKPKRSHAQATDKRDSESDSDGDSDSESERAGESETAPGFTPPTLQEITDYCQKRGCGVDPERFADYYAARGWRVGGGMMRDWKAALRTWERRGDKDGNDPKGPVRHPALRAGRDFGIRADNDRFA